MRKALTSSHCSIPYLSQKTASECSLDGKKSKYLRRDSQSYTEASWHSPSQQSWRLCSPSTFSAPWGSHRLYIQTASFSFSYLLSPRACRACSVGSRLTSCTCSHLSAVVAVWRVIEGSLLTLGAALFCLGSTARSWAMYSSSKRKACAGLSLSLMDSLRSSPKLPSKCQMSSSQSRTSARSSSL